MTRWRLTIDDRRWIDVSGLWPAVGDGWLSDALGGVGRLPISTVGERGVGGGQLQRCDFAAAERERQAVAPAILAEAADAEPLGHIEQGRHADMVEHAYGRDIRGG